MRVLVLGGDVAKRLYDKHVTHNGNNQAPITELHVRVWASHKAVVDTLQNTRSHSPAANISIAVTEVFTS